MMFNQLYPFRHAAFGTILLNQHDPYIRGAVEKFGEYSEAEVDVWRDILLPEDCCVEVGANMGVHTLALAKLTRQLHCFEPQRFMFQTLCGNLALNSVDNVVAHQTVVGRGEGFTHVPCLDPHTDQNFGSFSLRTAYAGGDTLPVLALDSLAFDRLDFLKLDCEGSELAVLQGARATLQQHRPWVYLEFTENRAALLDLLQQLGYFVARHCPAMNREPNFLRREVSGDDLRLTSDMLLACPADRDPRPSMQMSFGQRHQFFKAKDEEVIGHEGLLIEWVSLYE